MTEKLPVIQLPGSRLHKIIPARKIKYGDKLKELLSEYSSCLLCDVTNVGSSQIAEMRKDFRGKARFLFGKNTLIRKVIRDYIKESGNKQLLQMLELIKGNVGFCFTKGDVKELRKEILSRKVQCAAKAGSIAPADVWVPAGGTGMEPTQTSFFQVISVYDDGDAYNASVLDISDDDVAHAFFDGVRQVAALSLALQHPTIVSVPHSLLNAYKQVLSLGLSCNKYSFEKLDKIREILENPNAFAAVAKDTGKGKGKGKDTGGKPAAKEAEPEPEPEKEKSSSAAPMGMGMGDSSSDEDS